MNRRAFLRILPAAPIAAPAAALQMGQECPPVTVEAPLVLPPVGQLSGTRFVEFVLELAKRAGVKVERDQQENRR